MRFELDKTLGIAPDALSVYSKRAELLAGNIANADTPGYQARDIDFKDALQSLNKTATENGAARVRTQTTHAAHMGTSGGMNDRISEVLGGIKYRIPSQASIDGNSVDPLMEKAAFMENAMMYQTSIKFLGDKFRHIKAALKGE